MAKDPNKRLNTPLSLLDEIVYHFLIYASIPSAGALLVLLHYRSGDVAFLNNNAIAYESKASYLLVLPFLLFFIFVFLIVPIALCYEKYPIFGNKYFDYSKNPRAHRSVFSKHKPEKSKSSKA